MTTNILLIIIIVLLVLGLILQFFQVFAIATIPERLLESFLDEFAPDVVNVDANDVDIDLESEESAPEKIAIGFAKAPKSKKSRWTVPQKTQKAQKKSQKRWSRAKGSAENTEPETEAVN